MKRLLVFVLLIQGCILNAYADHITGGEVFYRYVSGINGMIQYDVTVRLFMRCNSGRQFNNPTVVSVFNKESGERINDYNVPLDRIENLSMVHDDPCVTNPPTVCYEVGIYHFRISVPENVAYTLTAHVNFRIDGINNLTQSYDRIGATYVSEIPATFAGSPGNNSAHFIGEDLVVVCANNSFTYSFAAEDIDGDDLRYSFCNAYKTDGLGGGFGGNISPPSPPPYQSVPYGNGFSGTAPLGENVKINSKTGLITGIAPARGVYVVTVCVEEIRNGEVIAVQRKDLQIFIAPCSITGAALPDEYMLCGNTQTLTAVNNSTSPLINSYNWQFLDANGNTLFETTQPEATYTFADTGLYTVKLYINKNQQCSDSTMAVARVYPGFQPDFDIQHPCITMPAQFIDRTTSRIGTVSSWDWEFGEAGESTDFSELQNPSYSYPSTGQKEVRLVVENTVGCRDTSVQVVTIYDKPPINLAFRDTLICPPDNLQLNAGGNGIFSWSAGVSDPTIASPFVSPTTTTTYYVDLDDDGCLNRDSVTVRVVDQVTLEAMNDATICDGDTIGLRVSSNGLKFRWTPASTLDDATSAKPVARPAGTTTYQVTASISGCTNTDELVITTVPYPVANAGADTTICFNTHAQLRASMDGSSFSWSPALQLSDANSLNPVAKPFGTTQYLLFVYDTKGCPKPGIDTVTVTVQPQLRPYAGEDTVVVTGQPLQLQASGGTIFQWLPATGLSDAGIANPVAIYNSTPAEGYYRYKVRISNETGCIDSTYMQVRVFASGPEIYVPNAFSPNGDGKNDFFQLVAAGIRNIEIFRVYNRWGQLLFDSPATHSRGWDGLYGGKLQAPDTYVWVVKAIDYTGQPIFKKGTVILIR